MCYGYHVQLIVVEALSKYGHGRPDVAHRVLVEISLVAWLVVNWFRNG